MKFAKLAAALVLCGVVSPATAQTVPSDVRCLLLANGFTKSQDAREKEAATQTLLFYVGRLDGRISDQALAAAMQQQRSTLDVKTAAAEMNACAARLNQAKLRLQNLSRPAAPKK